MHLSRKIYVEIKYVVFVFLVATVTGTIIFLCKQYKYYTGGVFFDCDFKMDKSSIEILDKGTIAPEEEIVEQEESVEEEIGLYSTSLFFDLTGEELDY